MFPCESLRVVGSRLPWKSLTPRSWMLAVRPSGTGFGFDSALATQMEATASIKATHNETRRPAKRNLPAVIRTLPASSFRKRRTLFRLP